MLFICFAMAVSDGHSASFDYNEQQDVLMLTVDKCIPNEDYSVIIITEESDSVASGNLLFIDQLTAGTAGILEIAFIRPSFPKCKALTGGKFADGLSSPRIIGHYTPAADVVPAVLPENLQTIEAEAFMNCSFVHIILGENVVSIGEKAFCNSSALTLIYIPASTTSIASNAFEGCSKLVIGGPEGSYAQEYAQSKGIPFRVMNP